MRKLFIIILLISIVRSADAQYNYNLNGNDNVPVTGQQAGLLAGGFTCMLTNRDDLNADERLDINPMNFSYAFGAERTKWFEPWYGFGVQINYWKGGSAYTGYDTITKNNLTGKADLTYLKIPILFHYKSYNGYHPNRRVRFNAYFGPYAAITMGYNNNYRFYNDATKYELLGKITNDQITLGNSKGTTSSKMIQFYDLGFVFAVGGEMRLGRKSVLTLHLRTDVGFINIENHRAMKFKPDGSSTETDYNYWNSIYAMYNEPNALDKLVGWVSNRPATKNFSTGIFISYRKYIKQ